MADLRLDSVTLEASSPLLVARNIVRVEASAVVWVTRVNYRSRVGRLMWGAAAPLHLATMPLLLGSAARRLVPAAAPLV